MFLEKIFQRHKQAKTNSHSISFLSVNNRPNIVKRSFLRQNRGLRSLFFPIGMAILVCLHWVLNTAAHFPEQSYLYFKIYDQVIETRVEITVEDLNQALSLDLPTDQNASSADIEPHLDQIRDYIKEHLTISANQENYPLTFQGYDLFKTDFAQFVTFDYRIDNLEEIPKKLGVYYGVLLDIKPGHKNLVVIEHNWKTGTFDNEADVSLILTPNNQQQTLDLSSSTLLNGFLSFVKRGVLYIWQHIDTDHLLFLTALILPSVLQRENSRWQPVESFSPALIYIVKVVVLLTIARSITLTFATLKIVTLPARLIESVVAGSTVIVAVDIIYPILKQKIWLVIFVYGIFQGFGFGSMLAELDLFQEYTFLSLFGFNLGVELVQIAIITVIFAIFYLLRKQRFYTKFLLKFGAIFLCAFALYWFIEYAFNINLPGVVSLKEFFQSLQ